MIRLKQLTIVYLLAAAVAALSSTAPHDQPNSSIHFQGKRPQPIFQQETSKPSTDANEREEFLTHSLGTSKVIIRPVSQLTTPAPLQSQQPANDSNDGCKCEPIDSCPIELMDFRFAVSCEYGTVRCCRPSEPVLIKETTPSKPVVVTPASTLKWPKKSCRCKPRRDCDEQSIDRKSETSCTAGFVRCCETGTKIENHKIEVSPEAHVLGGNGFRPVQLPFLKMPQPADERISEQEPRPSDQELEPTENATPVISGNTSLEDSLLTTTEKEQETNQGQVEEQQNLPALTVQQFQPSRPLAPTQQQTNQQFGTPIRQPNFPIRNPTLNKFSGNQNPMNNAPGPQFQQPVQNQPPSGVPLQQLPIRPSPIFRPPNPGAVNHPQLGQPIHTQFQPSFPMGPPMGQPIPFQSPLGTPNFNQQQLPPLPPHRRPATQSQPNTFQQQQFQRPPPAPTGGGGFFSSLMNMFN
ncbi:hypothetical protein GHT06_013035 [Daphnia sinensis]|uniref:Uncharacterized protein n=1 Tax=Daphnia sinensis TaxID=1820382 RepID=A0AAD5LHE7_9CRUS|nr:hypothetical protein GHT06_013035 [Daphnia sinensis]